MFRLLLFNKPMGVLSRFTDNNSRETLASYIDVPHVYPIGRLDKDSEGLLLLTDRSSLVEPLLQPGGKEKSYLVCVEGEPDSDQLEALAQGPTTKLGPSRPVKVKRLPGEPEWLWPREPPIRFRKTVPVSWLELVLTEGKNRQVRRMTAAVGLPTLRLVRTGFAGLCLDSELNNGSWREATEEEKSHLLTLEKSFSSKRKKKRRRRR